MTMASSLIDTHTITPAYTHQDSDATPTYAGTRIRCSGRKYSPAPAITTRPGNTILVFHTIYNFLDCSFGIKRFPAVPYRRALFPGSRT